MRLDAPQTPLEKSTERRNHPRFTCHGPVLLFPMAGVRMSWPAIVRDVSAAGLGLTIDRRFERGTALRLEWQTEKGAAMPPLLGRVVRLFEVPELGWWHGCSLIGELDVAEVLAFLHAAPMQSQQAVDRLKTREFGVPLRSPHSQELFVEASPPEVSAQVMT
jgi:hypothetical protein